MEEMGLFQNRHNLPVTSFFFSGGWSAETGFKGHPGDYDILFMEARRVWAELMSNGVTVIHLFVTGLSVGLCAVLEAKPKNAILQAFHYDRESNQYLLGGTFYG